MDTATSIQQQQVENDCLPLLNWKQMISQQDLASLIQIGIVDSTGNESVLLRKKHVDYLSMSLRYLPRGFQALDASRPWMTYWLVHGLDLLGCLPENINGGCVETLKNFEATTGGFGGNYKQIAHAAATYASCMTLAVLGTKEAYLAVDRQNLYRWMVAMKDPNTGAFAAHEHGEVDVRVTYCILAVASLYGMLTDELRFNVVEYVVSCQTYEGGFGGEPGNEAHGGYAYCAIATLYLLQDGFNKINVPLLCHWITMRQMQVEGGYQGRTNKLVDGCYTWWQGAIPVMLGELLGPTRLDQMCNRKKLQKYVLLCAQQLEGGLRDKPGKHRDHYHTCYCLSGLSMAQHGNGNMIVEGMGENVLVRTHPAYNVSMDKVAQIKTYFAAKPFQPE